MSRIEIWEDLTKIFRAVFNDENLTITETTSSSDIEKWNLINQISLIIEVQEKWTFEIDPDQIHQINSVGCFIDVILNHIYKQAV